MCGYVNVPLFFLVFILADMFFILSLPTVC